MLAQRTAPYQERRARSLYALTVRSLGPALQAAARAARTPATSSPAPRHTLGRKARSQLTRSAAHNWDSPS